MQEYKFVRVNTYCARMLSVSGEFVCSVRILLSPDCAQSDWSDQSDQSDESGFVNYYTPKSVSCFRSFQRKKDYLFALTVCPQSVKTTSSMEFVLRPIMAKP
jgi:hypothetical protein